MANEAIIRVENLGKCYRLAHEARHDTLRDSLAHGAEGFARRLLGRSAARATSEEFWALRDISFEVQRGEVVGVIGRNGAGKSTLLKILSRITEPTQGRVHLRGRVASLLEVGTGFHPELTGRENIFLNGAILGMGRAEIARKFDEIVAFAEVERFLDTPVKHYSSGMYVRLAFAVAAHLEPEILIVDEVLAVGDAQFQQKCLGKMESVAASEGRTVLFVSHNVAAIARLCSTCLLLDQGRLAFAGNTAVSINRYLSATQQSADGTVALTHEGWVRGAPVKLLSITFNRGQPLLNRQPVEVMLRFSADREIHVGFGIGFCNVEGRRVVTWESDYSHQLHRANQGEHTMTLTLPRCDLIPGRYRIDVGAFGPQHQPHHYFPDCCQLDVQPGPQTPPHLHSVHGEWRPDGTWSLTSS
ncbi:MAG: ABC transporter ATP-binding protein [Opitutus sp.]|nr:ABC transporter ATP-binding protein [Opitutus sp.]